MSFLESFGGLALALLGASLAVGLSLSLIHIYLEQSVIQLYVLLRQLDAADGQGVAHHAEVKVILQNLTIVFYFKMVGGDGGQRGNALYHIGQMAKCVFQILGSGVGLSLIHISVVDMKKLGPWNITIDCDVLQGDGGTRTASITGGFVAMMLAFRKMIEAGQLAEYPVSGYVAAVSAGIVDDVPLLDLCYEEDSSAMVDMNCVMDDQGRLIEIQGTGEERPFTLDEQRQLVELCEKGILRLQALQKEILGL